MTNANVSGILAILTPVLACLTTIVGLYFKDKADARRWDEGRERSDLRHAENVTKLDHIEENVNGKMAQLIDRVTEQGGT